MKLEYYVIVIALAIAAYFGWGQIEDQQDNIKNKVAEVTYSASVKDDIHSHSVKPTPNTLNINRQGVGTSSEEDLISLPGEDKSKANLQYFQDNFDYSEYLSFMNEELPMYSVIREESNGRQVGVMDGFYFLSASLDYGTKRQVLISDKPIHPENDHFTYNGVPVTPYCVMGDLYSEPGSTSIILHPAHSDHSDIEKSIFYCRCNEKSCRIEYVHHRSLVNLNQR